MDGRLNLGIRLLARVCVSTLLILLVLLAGVKAAFAQGQGNAVILGTVNDSTGVVPGATVTVTDNATGVARTAVSNEQGVFRLLSLPPARYSIKVEVEGFKQLASEVTLLTGETRDLGRLTLEVGVLSETIMVTAAATPVQTSSSALQKNLSGDLLTSVQVKGRDIFGMMKILPGVTDAKVSRDFAQWDSGRYLNINGGLSLNKNTTIDGVPSGEEGGAGTTHITPNIDSVAEVNVITNGYTAENGRMASGQIIMTTKSGTSQLKGSAWYHGRRDWMNKNDFFRIKQGALKPPFAVNIGGFSLGGPVVIPGLLDSRKSGKRVFFFGSNESTQDVRPTALAFTNLPTALERAGDFSQSYFGSATGTADGTFLSGARNLITLKNPNTYADFFCETGTGGLSGVPCAGTSASTNILNPKYFDPTSASMLRLLPMPNGRHNAAKDQFNTANDLRDTLPRHTRRNYLIRVDTVLSDSIRFAGRWLRDRDDSTTYNRVAPGIGSVDNTYYGDFVGGNMTWVLSPTVVNEITSGITEDWYGFRTHPGALVASDYTSWFRGASNGLLNTTMPDPPRLAPYPSQFVSRDPLPLLGSNQAIQLPYFPDMTFAGGNLPAGTNSNQFRPSGGSGPLPRQNYNPRISFQDDLSILRGRHSLKFGFAVERNAKTEPGSNDVNGIYDFGDSATNPLSVGDGFANALLGVYGSYTERNFRNDRNDVHWLGEGYAQDTWRVTPHLTLDYGVRFTHTGSMYEVRGYNSGFNPTLYNPAQAGVLFVPYCLTGVAGNQPCATANRAAKNPITGQVVAQAFAGTIVPGSGSVTDGFFTGGLPGKKKGEYDSLKYMTYGPRFGFAWDVTGDGKTAIRGAAGVFYNFASCCFYYPYNGGPQITIARQILNATIADIPGFVQSGNLAVTPQGSGIPLAYNPPLAGNDLKPGPLQGSRHYQANIAFQRDIGFHTVVEVAYVGNFGRHYVQTKTTNNVPVNAYANPANLFNNEAIAANFLRRNYPGVGALSYLTSDYAGLNYNSLQITAQRRLFHGFQMGGAYTFAKGEGMRGGLASSGGNTSWDFMTEEQGGMAALKKLYYGPIAYTPTATVTTASQDGQERRHAAVFHYSYQIPTVDKPILKWVLSDWEASGVTTIVSGDALNPVCNTGGGISGIANNDPSLSGVTALSTGNTRCEFVAGQSLFSGYDPSQGQTGVAVEDQMHFNVNALQRPLPFGTTFSTNGVLAPGSTGNLGNVPWGALRNPGWSNWDFTLARRFPVKLSSSHTGNLRVQLQFYNVFNQVEFNRLGAIYAFTSANATNGFGGGNTNTQTGKYVDTQPPFNGGITIRFDF